MEMKTIRHQQNYMDKEYGVLVLQAQSRAQRPAAVDGRLGATQ